MSHYHIEFDVDSTVANQDLVVELNKLSVALKDHIHNVTTKIVDDQKDIDERNKKRDDRILDKIIDIIKRDLTCYELDKGVELDRSSKLQEDLGLDSLDIIELVMKIEDEFEIEIKDVDAEKWHTLGDILNTVNEKVK